MPNKKNYCLVKDIETQDGGYVPFKVVGYNPYIVIGSPISGFKAIPVFSRYNGLDAKIKIVSDKYDFSFSVPARYLTQALQDIYKFTLSTHIGKNEPRISHTIISSIGEHKLNVSKRTLLYVLDQLRQKYGFRSITRTPDFAKYNFEQIIRYLERQLNNNTFIRL